MEKVIKKY